ncbi:MAG TPA: LPP20 family lipoprotein [Gammaproteobacteria bacterium]|nr:LPP20 family lipoprotein [Gammaproteobacteria bacterium]
MKSAKYVAYLGAALLVFGSLTACSSRTTVESNLGIKGAPDWVNKGSQALNDQNGKLIHGIGSAPSMNDQSLQQSTADDRARAEVARVLSSFMHVVSQDYSAAAGAGQDQQTQESVSRQIQNITDQNVSGARIIARWADPKTGSVWSLAELDMKQVKDMVANSKDMNAGFRDYFNSHADNLFDGMTQGDHK